MSTRWKIFRIICILQLLLVVVELLNTGYRLLGWRYTGYYLYKLACYGLIAAFLSQTLSILNYNYPDLPLGLRQKRAFNMLFLLNVLMIAFLFAQLITEWRDFQVIAEVLFHGHPSKRVVAIFLIPPAIALVNFLFQFVFLGGAYRLRRVIHERLVRSWDEKSEA